MKNGFVAMRSRNETMDCGRAVDAAARVWNSKEGEYWVEF
jgi:hypothetical protein